MVKKRLFQLLGLFCPRYFPLSMSYIKLRAYRKKHHIDQKKCKKLNYKYCRSYYKFFNVNPNKYFNNCSIKPLKNVVFIYWNGGMDNMPKMAKMCLERLISTTRFEVIILNNGNLAKYSTVDERIIKMQKNGEISIQLFSDILRINLLAIHDAIWVDSTIFLRKDFPIDIMEYDFVSPYCDGDVSLFDNKPSLYRYPDLSLSQIYFLAGKKKNIFIKWYDTLLEYLFSETKILKNYKPYYLSYFAFEFLSENDGEFKTYLKSRKPSNSNAECIEGLKDEIYDDEKMSYIFDDDTYLYKLSYKMNFVPKIDNKLTVFGKFLELYQIDENDVL